MDISASFMLVAGVESSVMLLRLRVEDTLGHKR